MRRATLILWLMMALRPLRGWAAVSMVVPQTASTATVSVAAEHPHGGAMPACHQAGETGSGGGPCQACDYCHAAIALAPRALPLKATLLAEPPAPTQARDTGRHAVGGLDRPPRPLLA